MTLFYKTNIRFITSIFLLFMLLGNVSWGQIVVPNTTAVTENFNSMSATITLPSNWRIRPTTPTTWATGAFSVTQQANSGTPTAGGTYNFGNVAGTDRAVGAMTSGSFSSPNSLMSFYRNTNASNITSLAITYNAERYRINTAAASIQFFYSLDGSTWIAVSAGDVAFTLTGASTYNFTPGLSISVSFSIASLTIANNADFYLRWNFNTTGSNSQGIAIDDVSVTATYAAACTPPTTQATSTAATSITASTATLNWTRGDGNNTLVAVRPNSAANVLPTNGTSYSANTTYGSGATTGTNNFSVYTGTGTSVNITGLTKNTLYTHTSYEYNTTGVCYLTSPLNAVNFTTLHDAPTVGSGTGATSSTFSANWTAVSGGGSAAFTYEIEVDDNIAFSSVNFTQSSISATNVNVNSGLSPSTTYYYRVRTVNAGGNSAWSAISTGISTTGAASAPTITTPTATSILSTTATLGANVTSDGGSAITARGTVWGTSPSPTGNSASTSGTTGVFTTAQTGFAPNTTYYYRGFATNSQGTAYSPDGTFTTPAAAVSIWTNPITGTNPNTSNPYTTGDVVNPNISVSGIRRGTGISGTSANNRYNANNWSTGAIDNNDYFEFTLVPNAGYKIDFTSFVYTGQRSASPSSHTFKSSDDNFSSGTGAPDFDGTTISLGAPAYQNITTAITFRFYTHNVSAGTTSYSIDDFTFNGSVVLDCSPPTVAPNSPTSSAIMPNSGTIGWSRGNGNNVIVVLSQGAAVSTNPASGVSYTPNAAFGTGASIGAGSVVYTGTGTNVNVTGLLSGTTYHYAVYEYANTNICYNQSPLTGSFTTSACTAPSTQASNFVSSVLGTTSLKIDWTRGNGDNVIVVARAGSTVNANPQSGNNSYTANSTFGSGSQIGTGNYVVYKGTGTSVNVTGLSPNTTYYFSVFEYNNTNTCYNTTELLGFETTQQSGLVGTQLKPGDMVFVGWDAQVIASSSGSCNSASGDKYYIMNMVDIIQNTEFKVVNSMYEEGAPANVRTNEWGGPSNAANVAPSWISVNYTGTGTIAAGSILEFYIGACITDVKVNGVTSTDFNFTTIGGNFNNTNVATTGGDQMWLVQGNFSTITGGHAILDGRVLYGISINESWVSLSESPTAINRESRIHPEVQCFNFSTLSARVRWYKNSSNHIGTKRTILGNLEDANNWSTATNNNGLDITLDYSGASNGNLGRNFTITSGIADGTWIGDDDSDWFNCKNWQGRTVPDSKTTVELNSNSVSNSNILASSTNATLYNNIATCKNLSIFNQEVNLEGSANNKLVVSGNILINGTGILDMNDGTATPDGQITIGGSWLNQLNESAFDQGGGRVTFKSTQPQGIINSTSDNETFYDIDITNSSLFALNSNLAAEGALSILGGTLDAINRRVAVAGNFMNNGSFAGTGSTVVLNGAAAQTIGGNSINTFNNMVITNPSSGGVVLGQNQNLTNTLSLTGTSSKLTTTGRIFTFLSDANNTARLAQVSGTSTIVGNITMQRYVPGNATTRLINYQLATPVSGAAVSQWQPSGNTPPTAPTNGFYISGAFTGKDIPANTGITAASTASLLTYNSTTGSYNQFPLAANTETLTRGVGYRGVIRDGTAANGFADVVAKTLALTGAPHVGNFDFALTAATANTLTSWNFVGNPYPCEIFGDLTNATHYPTRTNVNPAIYVFNSQKGSYNSYISGVGVLAGGGAWDGKIPSSQGFWVQSNAANPALRVSENAKTTGRTANWRTETPTYYRIKLSNKTGADEAVVRISEQATYNFDGEVDAQKLSSPISNGAPNIRLESKENVKLVINTIPIETTKPYDTLWINHTGSTNAAHTFTFYGFENFDSNVDVILFDKAKNIYTNMRIDNDYNFDNQTFTGNRFAIVHQTLKVEETTNLTENESEKVIISVQPNPFTNQQFQLQSNQPLEASQLKMYNIVGAEIAFKLAKIDTNKYQITVTNDTKGVLLLQIKTPQMPIIKKIIAE